MPSLCEIWFFHPKEKNKMNMNSLKVLELVNKNDLKWTYLIKVMAKAMKVQI